MGCKFPMLSGKLVMVGDAYALPLKSWKLYSPPVYMVPWSATKKKSVTMPSAVMRCENRRKSKDGADEDVI